MGKRRWGGFEIRSFSTALIGLTVLIGAAGCAPEPKSSSEAACVLLGQCSMIEITSDKDACIQLIEITKPMNDGSAPSLSKFRKGWSEIESLAFQVEDAELRNALNATSINIHSFVMEMEKNHVASAFIIGEIRSNFQDVLSACSGAMK